MGEKSTEVTRYFETLSGLASPWKTNGAFWQSRCSHPAPTPFCFGTVVGEGYWSGRAFSLTHVALLCSGVLKSLSVDPDSQIPWHHLPVLLSPVHSICSSWEWRRNKRLHMKNTDPMCNFMVDRNQNYLVLSLVPLSQFWVQTSNLTAV